MVPKPLRRIVATAALTAWCVFIFWPLFVMVFLQWLAQKLVDSIDWVGYRTARWRWVQWLWDRFDAQMHRLDAWVHRD